MKAGAIGLYEEALGRPDAGLLLRTACGRALPLQDGRWSGPGLRVLEEWDRAGRAFVSVTTPGT